MTEESQKYQSLLTIRARKLELNKEIQRSEHEIKTTWNALFHPKKQATPKTPTQRILAMASSSMGLIDGALLGWKLYKKFIQK
ncbi:MAG: hypothetical protein Q4E68_11145 [Prevotellaceae bacterium]|nr:hypothetical protein [Prevotellaceae bacterium]